MPIEQVDLERAMDRLEARFVTRFDRVENAVNSMRDLVGRHDVTLSSLLEKRRLVRAELGGESGDNRKLTVFHAVCAAAGAGVLYALFKLLGKVS